MKKALKTIRTGGKNHLSAYQKWAKMREYFADIPTASYLMMLSKVDESLLEDKAKIYNLWNGRVRLSNKDHELIDKMYNAMNRLKNA